MPRPVLTVIAGPNGSGKSTLIAYLRKQGVDFGTFINADAIAREQQLAGDHGAAQARKIADEQRANCLKAGSDFSFETVMSHESKIEFMQMGLSASMSKLADGYPDPHQRNEDWRLQVIELLPNSTK